MKMSPADGSRIIPVLFQRAIEGERGFNGSGGFARIRNENIQAERFDSTTIPTSDPRSTFSFRAGTESAER
jgi:hypothetical protein